MVPAGVGTVIKHAKVWKVVAEGGVAGENKKKAAGFRGRNRVKCIDYVKEEEGLGRGLASGLSAQKITIQLITVVAFSTKHFPCWRVSFYEVVEVESHFI
jgi:type IV secretory pathway TrbF-like protein